MNAVLWILQILLAAVFLLHGWLYVTWSPAAVERMRQRRPNARPPGIPSWFRTFIGVAELLAAAGLILPGVVGVLPVLTPLAAAGLMIVMGSAVVYHLLRRERSSAVFTGVLFLWATFVAYARWLRWPL